MVYAMCADFLRKQANLTGLIVKFLSRACRPRDEERSPTSPQLLSGQGRVALGSKLYTNAELGINRHTEMLARK